MKQRLRRSGHLDMRQQESAPGSDRLTSTSVANYIEDFSPGSGSRSAPRAWLSTDAPALDLSGEWQFRLHSSHHGLPEPFGPDGHAETVTVPSHWVLGPDGVPEGGGRG